MSGTRRKLGRMAAQIAGFREWQLVAGYTPSTTGGLLKVMGRLGRWMEVNDVGPERLCVDEIEASCRSLRSRPDGRVPRLRSVDPLIVYLLDVGVLEASKPPLARPVDELLGVYWSWLAGEHGLTPLTVLR